MKREQMGLIVKREDGSEIVNYDDENFPSYIYDGWVRPHVTWEKVPHFHEDLEFIHILEGEMEYAVTFSVDQRIDRSDPTQERLATYKVSAKVSPEGRIVDLNMKKVVK